MREPGEKHLFFDFETAPQADSDLRKYFREDKVKLPKDPGIFNENQVNRSIKDPEKQAAWLAGKRTAHAQTVNDHILECRKAVAAAFDEFRESAPLDPKTGYILACGYGLATPSGIKVTQHIGSEQEIVHAFWRSIHYCRRFAGHGTRVYSYNGHRFDFPFATIRAHVHDVKPQPIFDHRGYVDNRLTFVDVQEKLLLGRDKTKSMSLAHACMLFRVPVAKMEGMDGSMYWKEFFQGDREKANEYLARDILGLYYVTKKIGLLDAAFISEDKDD